MVPPLRSTPEVPATEGEEHHVEAHDHRPSHRSARVPAHGAPSGHGRTSAIATRAETLLVPIFVVVGVVGVALPSPARALDRAGAVDPTLAVLVLSAGMTVDVRHLRHAVRHWTRIAIVLLASSVVLPGLAWALSHLVSGALRDGVLALGVAPSEVASLGFAAIGGGEVSVAVALLVGSSLVTVLAGGPVLGALSGVPSVHPAGVVVTLVLVVGLPLVAGMALRHALGSRAGALDAGRLVSATVLVVLLWEVAGQVQLHAAYLAVVGALCGFLAGAGALGWVLTRGVRPSLQVGLALPTAMRDFAVAAGIATSAFGVRAAGPLGVYGVLVLVLGGLGARAMASAGRTPRRHARCPGVP